MILVRWLVVWVGVWWVGVAAAGQRPNVVILLADDLGIQDLGCFGRREHRTPHLDRLAAEGARFTQAYAAASVCSPSRAALLTGLSPARLRITTFLNGRSDRASHRLLGAPIERGLPAGATTLAEALRGGPADADDHVGRRERRLRGLDGRPRGDVVGVVRVGMHAGTRFHRDFQAQLGQLGHGLGDKADAQFPLI